MKAFLFDFDGVLVDTSHLHLTAIKRALYFFNVSDNDFDMDALQGESTTKIAQITRERTYADFSTSDFISLENKYFIDSLSVSNIEFNPGVKEILNYCNKWNLKTAIVTNANLKREVVPVIRSIKNSAKILNCFNFIITGDDVANRKPSPDIYIEAMKKFGLKGIDCIAFEDSKTGAKSAYISGCFVVGVGPQIIKKYAHLHLHTLHEVLSMVKELGHPSNIKIKKFNTV